LLGLDLLAVVALFACPAGVFISAAAEPLVETLLGDKWLAVILPLAVLGGWCVVIQVEAALGWFLNSIGRAGTTALVSAAVIVPLAPALYLGAGSGGITGIAWVVLGGSVVTSGALMVAVDRHADLRPADQLGAIRGVIAGGIVAWACTRLVADATAAAVAPLTLAVALAAGLVSYLTVVRISQPALLRRGGEFVRAAIATVRAGSDPGVRPLATGAGDGP
jgi:PST family polysaccharide transporter